jgi:choline transport protein
LAVWVFLESKLTQNRNHKWAIPFNSVYATSAIVAILSLIPLGSSLAFEILVSLSVQGLLSTYMISIGEYK